VGSHSVRFHSGCEDFLQGFDDLSSNAYQKRVLHLKGIISKNFFENERKEITRKSSCEDFFNVSALAILSE